MAERSFLSDMLHRIARRRNRGQPIAPNTLCRELLSDKGEVSGLVAAMDILNAYDAMDTEEKREFLLSMAHDFGVDDDRLKAAVDVWTPGDEQAARALHQAAEPASQELIRRLNRVPGGTARLVNMRADLLAVLRENPVLKGLSDDFQHVFLSWFNRGFLEIRRVDWSTSAEILEKIIAYEAVHAITGWDDLRQRVAAPDRRLFAFFHPAMPNDPLIFVEVALTKETPDAIAPILNSNRNPMDANDATTAVFYSISNCQKGLRGVSFGNFLIKQVVAELARELPKLKRFVTLSPVPGFRKWLEHAHSENDPLLPQDITIETVEGTSKLRELAARYLLLAKRDGRTAFDPVAHFHLGNGAQLAGIHLAADESPRGQRNAFGVMVNYLYDSDKIEQNHQAYANDFNVAAAAEIRVLAGLTKRL